jgi:hypothetical protein
MFVNRTLPHLKLMCERSLVTKEKVYFVLKHNSVWFNVIYIEFLGSAIMKLTYCGLARLEGALNSCT